MGAADSEAASVDTVRWIREWTVKGRLAYRVGRSGDELVAEWPGFAVLLTDRMGEHARFITAPDADPEIVSKFCRGLVNALLRHARGELTLHASAVERDGRALLCVGDSGAGKSSLAFAACRLDGVNLVSDDTAALLLRNGIAEIEPTEDVCWLSGEALALTSASHVARKAPVATARRATSLSRVCAVVSLVFDDARSVPRLRKVLGTEAFALLARSMFRLICDDPEVDLRDFGQLSALAAAVDVFELRRPRDIGKIGASVDTVIRLFDECA